jgi:hypothetical protein
MCASIAYTSITHDGTLYTSHSSMHGTQFHLGSHACVVLIDICIGLREAEMRVVIVAYTHYTRQRI